MFIKTPLLLFRQLPDVFLTMVKSFLYAKNKAQKNTREKEKGRRAKRERRKEREKEERKKRKAEKKEKEKQKTTKSEMKKSRKLFAATLLTRGLI